MYRNKLIMLSFRQSLRRSVQLRHFSKGYSDPQSQQQDTRNEILKRILYETEPTILDPSDDDDKLQFDTIERAWKLKQTEIQSQQAHKRFIRFKRMKEAHDELERLNTTLYEGAVWKEPSVLFPRRYKVWTETPPTGALWNYDYQQD